MTAQNAQTIENDRDKTRSAIADLCCELSLLQRSQISHAFLDIKFFLKNFPRSKKTKKGILIFPSESYVNRVCDEGVVDGRRDK